MTAHDLAGIAGSLGGARPKANLQGDGHLWIAKFTSAQDTKPVERAEVATLKLATECGLHAAEARLELRDSESPIALIRRFDRSLDMRIPYMSARSALGWQGEDGAFYTDITDAIRQIPDKSADDLNEFWRRIVFSILVSNKDDHLKNHGFIYVGVDLTINVGRHARTHRSSSVPDFTQGGLRNTPSSRRPDCHRPRLRINT